MELLNYPWYFYEFLLGLFPIFLIYCLVYIIVLFKVDCDVSLAFVEKFGKSVDELKGKVIWITGASSGIGEALAKSLAKSNLKLILSARRLNELERVKKECLEFNVLSDDDILVLPMDVTDLASHQICFDTIVERFGQLDILVNNAGRSQRAIWEDIELDVDRQLFDLNVFSLVALSRIVVKYFMEKGGGHIAVTSSLAGILPTPHSGSYTASKHAIHGYFGSLRTEKINDNISVTILCPGPIYTNFLQECFTAKPGEKFEQSASITDKRMSAERCGELCAIALANKLDEVWISLFPLIPLCYIFIYFPNFGKLLTKILGAKKFLNLRDSKNTMKLK